MNLCLLYRKEISFVIQYPPLLKVPLGNYKMCKHQMFKLKQQELKVFQKDFQKQKAQKQSPPLQV
ncbi:Uncharacterised protein [Segatella copri]|nr:Uncharacterised protein [Segatella copri]